MTDEVDMPVCPYCKESMRRVKYQGYYDEFTYWECNCGDEIKPEEVHKGAYT